MRSRVRIIASILYLYLLLGGEQKYSRSKRMRIPGTIIPAKIHQVQIHDEPMIFSLTDFFRHFYNKRFMKAWSYNNPDFEYYLWTDDTAATFVKDHYPQHMNEYLKLPTLALRASVFKYMVLNVLGGIFSDVDTVPLKPLKDWVKPDWVCHNVKFIAGLEFDIPTKYDNIWPEIYEYPLQLCSWTLASVPNHEILTSIITQIFDIIKKSTPEEIELMDGSKLAGPERLSRVIFSNWEKSGFSLEDFRNFGLEPKCFSNNLFLPIDYFNSALEGTKLFRSEAYIQYSGPRRSYDLSKKINEIM